MPSSFDFVTVEVRTVLVAAGVTARQDGRTEVRVDDLALALLGQRDGAVAGVWRRLGVDRDRLATRLRPERAERAAGPALRLDAAARRLWEHAYGIALDSRVGRVGTRHLLLALLEAGPAPLVASFAEEGVTAAAVRGMPDRVRLIERLPERPGVVARCRWQWRRSRRVVRRRRRLILAVGAPGVLLVVAVVASVVG